MRAKFINEGNNILKPKSEEEINMAFAGMDPQAAFNKAVEVGYLPKVKELIDNPEVDIHQYNDYALKWAATKGRIEVVKVLLNAGADVHAAMEWAKKYNHPTAINILNKFMNL